MVISFGTHFDWYNWCFTVFGAICMQVLPLLLPVALPPYTPTVALYEITHGQRLKWYTTGFE